MIKLRLKSNDGRTKIEEIPGISFKDALSTLVTILQEEGKTVNINRNIMTIDSEQWEVKAL